MARLFVTEREINFISDITKEYIKDVVGQKIYYYSISEVKTRANSVYNESPEKIFENPIVLDAIVGQPERDAKIDAFSYENTYTIEAYLHYRDMLDKQIELSIGDFFSYGSLFFEVTEITYMRAIYGQVEHTDGVKLIGVTARESNFKTKIFGPTDERYTDPDAVQKTFVQQRGLPENKEGMTGDKRELQENGTLDPPIEGQREISDKNSTTAGNTFYDELFTFRCQRHVVQAQTQ